MKCMPNHLHTTDCFKATPGILLSSHGVVFDLNSWSSIRHAETFMRFNYFIKVQDTNVSKPYKNWMSDTQPSFVAS